MIFLPRPYQNDAHAALEHFLMNEPGNGVIGLPTGTGKSVIPPMFMASQFTKYPNVRFGVFTHVKELIAQNERALRKIWPTAPVGVCSAGLKRWEPYAPIVFGGIQSCYKKASEIGHIDLAFIDEAHLIAPDDNTMYQSFFRDMKRINPNIRFVGLSATLFRMGHGRLTDQGGLFDSVIYDRTSMNDFLYFIDEFYLSNLITPTPQNIIDVTDVRELAYDFNQKDLQAIVDTDSVTRDCLTEGLDLAKDRKSIMVFGAGIQNCENLAKMMNAMGCPAVAVHSKLTDEQRDKALQAFQHGRDRAVVSYGILTTGFDHPQVDCIMDLRPTTSVVLHIQKYGRGTRPYYHNRWTFEQLRIKENRQQAMEESGKVDCLILDFAGNIARLGPINDPKIPKKKGEGTGEVPVKICEAEKMVCGEGCGGYNHTTAKFCDICGREFLFRAKIKPAISEEDVVRRSDSDVSIFDVAHVTRQVHQKGSKLPTLKVTYFTEDMKAFPVWLCFDHKGFAKHKAHEWWRQHFGDTIPETCKEADDWFPQCRTAKRIRVEEQKDDYPQILDFLF